MQQGIQTTGWLQVSRWGVVAVMCAMLTGCAHDWSPGLSTLGGGSVTSSQWEPEVDYEAERARQAE